MIDREWCPKHESYRIDGGRVCFICVPEPRTTIDNLRKALQYSLLVIESYALDANADPAFRAKKGFCQGKIYLEAPGQIRDALNQ